MILVKYVFNVILKNQVIILLVLFFISFFQKFVKTLTLIIDEDFSIYLVLIFILLSIPELLKLIIPFSIFLGISFSLYKLHTYNEIMAMFACATSKFILSKSILLFTVIVTFFSAINILWLSPLCLYYQNELISKVKRTNDLFFVVEKKFQLLFNQDFVLFVDNVRGNTLNNIFLFRKNYNTNNDSVFTIVTADAGHINTNAHSIFFTLKEGIYYEVYNQGKLYGDVCVAKFSEYSISIDRVYKNLKKNNPVSYMSSYQLWMSTILESKIEFHWRLTLLFSVIIASMIAAFLLNIVSGNYFLYFLYVFVLYLFFFLLHIVLRFYIFLVTFNPILCMWLINIIYFIIGCLINCNSIFYIKNIISKLADRYIQ